MEAIFLLGKRVFGAEYLIKWVLDQLVSTCRPFRDNFYTLLHVMIAVLGVIAGLELPDKKSTYFILTSEFFLAMREVASISFHAVSVLGIMLAQSGLVQVVKLLPSRLLLRLDDRHWYKLCHRCLLLLDTVAFSLPLQRL